MLYNIMALERLLSCMMFLRCFYAAVYHFRVLISTTVPLKSTWFYRGQMKLQQFIGVEQPKCNVTLVHEQPFACTRIIAIKRGVVPSLLTSIHLLYSGVNTYEQNGSYAPLIRGYSQTSASKCLLTHECNVALEQYHICIIIHITELIMTAETNQQCPLW